MFGSTGREETRRESNITYWRLGRMWVFAQLRQLERAANKGPQPQSPTASKPRPHQSSPVGNSSDKSRLPFVLQTAATGSNHPKPQPCSQSAAANANASTFTRTQGPVFNLARTLHTSSLRVVGLLQLPLDGCDCPGAPPPKKCLPQSSSPELLTAAPPAQACCPAVDALGLAVTGERREATQGAPATPDLRTSASSSSASSWPIGWTV